MAEALHDSDSLHRYARSRDEATFAELVRRYLPLVYHAAARQLAGGGAAHAAEEVTQKVFTLAACKAPALSGQPSLAGWPHTAARFVAGETTRAEQRRRAQANRYGADGCPVGRSLALNPRSFVPEHDVFLRASSIKARTSECSQEVAEGAEIFEITTMSSDPGRRVR